MVKMAFKKKTTMYTLKGIDLYGNLVQRNCLLVEKRIYKIQERSTPFEGYKYEILGLYDIDREEKCSILINEEDFNEYFRLPREDCWQIKLFTTEEECNDFLAGLNIKYLKGIKFTENQIAVIYLVKEDIEF